jgi:integrase
LYSPYSDSPALIPGNVCRPTTDCADELAAANCNEIELLRLLDASTTHSTKRSYESDFRHFVAWGGLVPAIPVDVAKYLAAHAGGLSVATLARRLVAIGQAHGVRGLPDPTKTELVRRTMRGIRRTYGRPQRRATALTTEDVLVITSRLGNALVDIRDRALLLMGFAGAFRRSELVAIDYEAVRPVVGGLEITIPRSKSDQRVAVGSSSFLTDVCRPVRSRRFRLGSLHPASARDLCFVRCVKGAAAEQTAFRREL